MNASRLAPVTMSLLMTAVCIGPWAGVTRAAPLHNTLNDVWTDEVTEQSEVVPITVVDADPPRSFSFRWVYAETEVATATNSLLVTFELVPTGAGTVVRLTETGFREKGWKAAVLEEHYAQHCIGWDTFLPRLGECVKQLVSSR